MPGHPPRPAPTPVRFTDVVILIDPPGWPAHGRMWSHLASDTSVAELHDFAARAGIPPRAFEGDHYDVPAERYNGLVEAGAVPTSSRELLAAIVTAGLRRHRRRGEQVIHSREVDDYYPAAGSCRVDVIVSALQVPSRSSRPGWWIDMRGDLIRVQEGADGWQLPRLDPGQAGGAPLGYVRVKILGPAGPAYRGPAPWVFHAARRPHQEIPGHWVEISGLGPELAGLDVWRLVERLHLMASKPEA